MIAKELLDSCLSRSARTVLTWSSVITVCATLGGCAADQVYSSVRNAQRLQCHRLAEELLRQRCLRDANILHGSYQEQAKKIQRKSLDGGASVPVPTTTESDDTNIQVRIEHAD